MKFFSFAQDFSIIWETFHLAVIIESFEYSFAQVFRLIDGF